MLTDGMPVKSREWIDTHQSSSGIAPNTIKTLYTHYNGQVTVSMGHGGPPRPGSAGDKGGPFMTTLRKYEDSNSHVRASAGSEKDGIRTYDGPVYAFNANSRKTDYPVVVPSTEDELDSLGTSAISAVIPTNPTGSMVTTLGELRSEGIPHLLGAQNISNYHSHKFQREAGSETALAANAPGALSGDYLNYAFGWRPLLSELHAFARNVKDSEKVLHQYRKGSDKKIKRRFSFPAESSTVTTLVSSARYPAPTLDSYLYGPTEAPYQRGPLYKTVTTTTRRWFEGAFRYHVPVGNDVASKFARFTMEADRLFGVAPTPEVVYNLTPWSWAFDWVGNMGDVMTNVSAFMADGLVMQYGYMMETKSISVEYVLAPLGGSYSAKDGTTGTTGRKPGMAPRACFQRYTTTVKQRSRATPYGFGLDWDGFSSSQLGILAALGISRSVPRYT